MSEARRSLAIRIVAEGMLIVLSILLALWVDGWRERRAEERLRDEALARIRAEIADNLEAVERVMPYHDSILAASGRLLAEPAAWRGRSVVEVGPSLAPRGLVPPLLQTTAWDAANAAEAVALLDFEVASAISSVYGWQREGVTRTMQRVADHIFTPGSFEPERTGTQLRLVQALVQEMRAQEESLAREYRRVLETLDAAGGRVAGPGAEAIDPETAAEPRPRSPGEEGGEDG